MYEDADWKLSRQTTAGRDPQGQLDVRAGLRFGHVGDSAVLLTKRWRWSRVAKSKWNTPIHFLLAVESTRACGQKLACRLRISHQIGSKETARNHRLVSSCCGIPSKTKEYITRHENKIIYIYFKKKKKKK